MTASRMLRFRRLRACRCAGVPGTPNSRSKTTRGLVSIGSGVVGEDHEMVFMYEQLNPVSHAPTYEVKSSVANSSEGKTVSWPICLAMTWSIDTPR